VADTDKPRVGVFGSLLMGLLLIVVGIIMLADPKMSLSFFTLLFGLGVIAYGVIHAVVALWGKKDEHGNTQRAAGTTAGILAVIAGFIILAWPGLAVGTMIYIVAGWAIVAGVIDLARVFMKGASALARVWHVISGIAGIVLGFMIMLWPAGGVLAILWLVGIYLIVIGILKMIMGVVAPAGRVGQVSEAPHPF
jgi:uncharacterized membrane protein HdeD (DUF308 family)